MKKRILAIVLCLTMVLTTGSLAFAAEEAVEPATSTPESVEVVEADAAEGTAATEAVEPALAVEEPEESVVGKTGALKKGTVVYSEADTNSKYHTIAFAKEYLATIEAVIEVDGVVWYEYSVDNYIANFVLKDFPYVKASDFVVGSVPNEDEEPEEPSEPDIELDMPYVHFDGVAGNGMGVKVSAPEGAFPEGVDMSVTEDNVSVEEVKAVIDEEILGIVSADISFSGNNPTKDVVVYLDITEDKIPDNANKVIIVHMGSNGPEVVGSKYMDTSAEGEVISFTTDSFSSYAAVFVNGKYSSKKMSTILANNSRYEIATFPVDLFDYDPVKMNNALNDATLDKNGFHFTGYGITGMGSNNGINNSSSTHAKQGILESTLVDGLPVIKYLEGTNAGKESGKLLFDDTITVEGRTLYDDIPFEFIFDKTTGYYEYKSSVNHAQLNDARNKIELYADTLSTENVHISTVDLSTASGESDFIESTKASNSYRATAKDSTKNDRIDPYVVFTVDDVDAANVGQIYVKAKVPASVNANNFQLFFTTNNSTAWEEPKSFGNPTYSKEIPYTANGDWIEFVVDTSENPNWKDKITAIRVDLFDSNKGDLDITKTYPIEISEIKLIKKNIDQYTTRGGFYPFSEIEDSYPGNNTAFSMNNWETNFLDDEATTAIASRSIFNPTPSSETIRYAELAYGLVSEFDFYLPVDKMGLGDKPLTYFFDGDDDLWVFVDGKLVLDIGGGHGAITGSINFTDGTWQVDSANTVTGYNSGADGDYSEKSGSLPTDVNSPGKHTMKIFYLERGGSVSNCFMKFNLPRTPQGSVEVSKSVVKEDNGIVVETDNILANEQFEFNVKVTDKGEHGTIRDQNYANKEFYITTTDGSSSTAMTDENGNFMLKDGEYAIFVIDENYKVTVTEIAKEVNGYESKGTTINGTDGTSASLTTVEGQTKEFAFVNKYDENEVTIKYVAVNPENCPNEMKGTVSLTGTQNFINEVSETVGTRTGEPAGSTAKDTDAVKFVGWYTDPECEGNPIESNEVFEPSRNVPTDPWEEATYYAKFEYMYGDIKITKEGVSGIDHHLKNNSSNEEEQANIFNIKGTSYSGVTVDMNVAINGNDYVIIKNIPVGTYDVTEIIDWPWRYAPVDSSYSVTVTDGEESSVTFTNNRNYIYWLNGGAYSQNVFKNSN